MWCPVGHYVCQSDCCKCRESEVGVKVDRGAEDRDR